MLKLLPQLLMLFSLLWVCAPFAGAQTVEQRMQSALDEMAELEQRLEQINARALAAQQELERQGLSVDLLDERILSRQETREEGRVALNLGLDQATRQEQDMKRELSSEHKALDAAQAGSRRLAVDALMALESGASAKLSMPRLLLLRHHSDRATVASGRIMRTEIRLSELANERQVLHEANSYYSGFSELGGNQLRARHELLAARVEALRKELSANSQTTEKLAARRNDLKSLVQKLVEQQVAAETRDGSVFNGLMGEDPVVASETPSPQSTPAAGGTVDLIGETGETSDTGEGPDGPKVADRNLSEGVRRLFWRANPVAVRSLAGGQVVFARPFSGYRHVLILKHGNGWFTVIGNLSRCDVREGDLIGAQKPLGMYQAAMGRHAEPLWFEVRENATPRHPDDWPALPTGWEKKLFGE